MPEDDDGLSRRRGAPTPPLRHDLDRPIRDGDRGLVVDRNLHRADHDGHRESDDRSDAPDNGSRRAIKSEKSHELERTGHYRYT